MKWCLYSILMTFLCAPRQSVLALLSSRAMHQRCITSLPSSSLCSKRVLVGTINRNYTYSSFKMYAMPKRGAIVDSYRTVDVACNKCRTTLYEYKKKNGTKSSLVKMFIERIVKDPFGILTSANLNGGDDNYSSEFQDYSCPKCGTKIGRHAVIKGLPAIKIIGNRLRMK